MAGNATILKTSEYSPRTHLAIVEVFRLAGLPDGVLNVRRRADPTVADRLRSCISRRAYLIAAMQLMS